MRNKETRVIVSVIILLIVLVGFIGLVTDRGLDLSPAADTTDPCTHAFIEVVEDEVPSVIACQNYENAGCGSSSVFLKCPQNPNE